MDKVNVYFINHKQIEEEYFGNNSQKSEVLKPLLPAHYMDQLATVKNEVRRTELVCSALLLKKHLGISRDEDFRVNEEGCLSLKDGSRNFCLSHARDYTILALSKTGLTLGADVEEIHSDRSEKQVRQRMLIAKKVMPPKLLELYQAASPDEEPLVFTRLWTRVEAMLKAEGRGFNLDPRVNPDLFDKWQNFVLEYDSHVVSVACQKSISLCMELDEEITEF